VIEDDRLHAWMVHEKRMQNLACITADAEDPHAEGSVFAFVSHRASN